MIEPREMPCWITGVGTISPLGTSFKTSADNLLAGKSGIRAITRMDVSRHSSQIAGVIEEVPVPFGCDPQEFGRFDRALQLLMWCCTQALLDSGLWAERQQMRIGLVLGLGCEWMLFWEADRTRGGKHVHEPSRDNCAVAADLRRRLGITGPVTTVAAACASGNFALDMGRRWLRLGWADVCLAGAVDRAVTPMALACFGNLGALSRRNSEPAAASRPFDINRDGLVMGEGGAVMIMEPAERARRRGARAYAELAGFGASSDAFHMIAPSPQTESSVTAMQTALGNARLNVEEIDYVNAHATSTLVGDSAEARVLQTVLGEAVNQVPVSSTKSMTGHLMSGAAAMDVVACLTAIERQALPPTINLDEPDPACQLRHIIKESLPCPVRTVVSNAFGFGGNNTCIVLRKAA
jgi:3-oxoacyl-[acyl-carrier-protein] synthase II